jgi:beta-mannosidase
VSKANQVVSLIQGWQVRLDSGRAGIELPKTIHASVPGSIHTDLMDAGLIPDPFLDDNERLLAWIGYCDWRYSLDFDWQGSDKANTDLVFEGIDTVASIYLNGKLVGEVANQHRSYRYDAKPHLIEGKNKLEVVFKSPIRYADRMSLELGYRPHVNHHPYNAVRKMAANFGWDWGIDTSTVGLFKPVYLESYDVRIQEIRPILSFDDNLGFATIEVALEGTSNLPLHVKLGSDLISVTEPVQGINKIEFTVKNPKLWYPIGEGDQNRYELEVWLGEQDYPLAHRIMQVGFRRVQVEFPKSEDGIGFEFVVNNRPTFIRGVNWIPDDAFIHRITRQSLRKRLEQAKAANINLIRVWGGGLYESEDFYELCDELGLMVWQDFLFACASYSEEGLGEEVEAEARENIARIMKHPSLALWNGNNENLWGHQEWNWKQRLEGKSWGAGFYFELLPSLVAELDPGRAYTPGSPYSPDPEHLHNDPNYGSVHIWDLWNQKDYPHFLDYSPRFVAEFGWQGPANWATIQESISDNPLTPESPGMLIHQKAMSGNDKLTDGLVNHFSLPNNMEDWHFAMQLNQANAIRFGLLHMRSQYPRCMGAVVWQLNDCWPVTSWAAIDGRGREKPLYFSIAQSYEPLLVTISGETPDLSVNIINNTLDNQSGQLSISLLDFSGRQLAEHMQQLEVGPSGKHVFQIPKDLVPEGSESSTVLVASFNKQRATHFFADYKHSALENPEFKAETQKTETGLSLKVTAQNTIRDFVLMIDKLDPHASVDTGLITLLPGESHVFIVTTNETLSVEQLVEGHVLRSANQLVTAEK